MLLGDTKNSHIYFNSKTRDSFSMFKPKMTQTKSTKNIMKVKETTSFMTLQPLLINLVSCSHLSYQNQRILSDVI